MAPAMSAGVGRTRLSASTFSSSLVRDSNVIASNLRYLRSNTDDAEEPSALYFPRVLAKPLTCNARIKLLPSLPPTVSKMSAQSLYG